MSEDNVSKGVALSKIEELAVYIDNLLEDDDSVWGDIGAEAAQEIIGGSERYSWAQQQFEAAPEGMEDYVGDLYFELCYYPAREKAIVAALELVIASIKEGSRIEDKEV